MQISIAREQGSEQLSGTAAAVGGSTHKSPALVKCIESKMRLIETSCRTVAVT